MRIKVCGMRDAVNMGLLSGLPVDYMGLIFYPKSPRYVEDNLKPEHLNEIKGDFEKVGVFVNENLEAVIEKGNNWGLDLVQLHGDESPEFCTSLKKYFKVIKAFRLDKDFNFDS
ncbi:phosphoribosylanthranilate isomerase, partial [Xanthovirga aplysinae]|uniref:phosphoribosylanthranilate isomerase n=1 Tax=Xanthovirga aplysinae TaxID=2529853 RepID=UPI001656E2BE